MFVGLLETIFGNLLAPSLGVVLLVLGLLIFIRTLLIFIRTLRLDGVGLEAGLVVVPLGRGAVERDTLSLGVVSLGVGAL